MAQTLAGALSTLKAGGTVPISKTSAARMVNGVIYIYNPQIVYAYEFVGDRNKVAAAVKAGKISPITKEQLAAALKPTPQPSANKSTKPKSKPKKGKADDDSEKKQTLKLRTDPDPELKVGLRPMNPLGWLPSYTYQLSLYMVTPDAYDAFVKGGRKDLNAIDINSPKAGPEFAEAGIHGGAWLIAQSGGSSPDAKAPSFVFDYGIDNLKMKMTGPKENGASINVSEFTFQIIEPYGFSFISNLRRAGDALKAYSKLFGKKKKKNQGKRPAKKGTTTGTGSKNLPKGGRGGGGGNRTGRNPVYEYKDPNRPDLGYKAARELRDPNRPDLGYVPKRRPKGGAGGGRAPSGHPYRNRTDQFDKEQAKKSTGNGKQSSSSSGGPKNPARNFFILGIRFFGYDTYGRPVKGSDIPPGADGPIDPASSDYALFQRYYDIVINEIKVKLDGKATVYNIKAASTPEQKSLSKKTGVTKNDIKISGGTVDEAINKLFTALNKESTANAKKGNNNYTTYTLSYGGPDAAIRIGDASIISKADVDKYKWPGSGAKKSSESNDATASKSAQKPKNNKIELTINKGTPIIQAIDQIIAQSQFMEDALSVVYNTSVEPNDDKDDFESITKDNPGKILAWYNCAPEVSGAVWDDNTNDWVFDINYMLDIYETPAIDAAYINPKKNYYGPVKRYNYWYTGDNREILKYEHVLDQLYTHAVLDADGKTNGTGSDTPKSVGTRTSQPKQGKAGLGMEAQNSFRTYLNDPASNAKATIVILGDPDLLGVPPESTKDKSASELTIYNKFYGKANKGVNFRAGQTFIEIDFKEAVDYKSELGYMLINDSIMFWDPPKNKKTAEARRKVKGISYQINQIDAHFQNGVFRQTLGCSMNNMEEPDDEKKKKTGRAKQSATGSKPRNTGSHGLKAKGGRTSGQGTPGDAEASRIRASQKYGPGAKYNMSDKRWVRGGSLSGAAPRNSNATTTNTGLKQDRPTNTSVSAAPSPTTVSTGSRTTPTGPGGKPVAGDT